MVLISIKIFVLLNNKNIILKTMFMSICISKNISFKYQFFPDYFRSILLLFT